MLLAQGSAWLTAELSCLLCCWLDFAVWEHRLTTWSTTAQSRQQHVDSPLDPIEKSTLSYQVGVNLWVKSFPCRLLPGTGLLTLFNIRQIHQHRGHTLPSVYLVGCSSNGASTLGSISISISTWIVSCNLQLKMCLLGQHNHVSMLRRAAPVTKLMQPQPAAGCSQCPACVSVKACACKPTPLTLVIEGIHVGIILLSKLQAKTGESQSQGRVTNAAASQGVANGRPPRNRRCVQCVDQVWAFLDCLSKR